MLHRSTCCLFLVLGAAAFAAAEDNFKPRPYDWPQWQGQNRTAISTETGLLSKWPEGGPKLLWKATNLGLGYSTPSVAAGRIFSMGFADDNEYVFCLRESDGKTLWKTSLGPAKRISYTGTRCTPTVDGDWLYALGVHGELACMHVADGKIRWRVNFPNDYSGRRGGWGYAESPLVDGEKLIVTPGGSAATLLALNKLNGEMIWKCPIDTGYRAGYSSIIKIDVDGLPQYVQFLGGAGRDARNGAVVGVRATDGKLLWSFSEPGNSTANISTPIFADNCVFAASAYGTGGALAAIKREGENATASVRYATKKLQNQHGGMVLYKGYIYGSSGGLVCMDFKTGEVAWTSRKPGRGSIALADGKLYYRDERRGTVTLIEANPKEYVELGRFEQPDRSRQNAWAHPVIANGRLYIADQNVLLCYDVKK